VLQCVVMRCSTPHVLSDFSNTGLQVCVVVCCSMLQCVVAAPAISSENLQILMCRHMLQCVAVYCSMLRDIVVPTISWATVQVQMCSLCRTIFSQCVAICCSVS